MALMRQPVTTLTPQSIDRDRQLAQLLLGQAQQQRPQGPGALIGGLAQALAGQRRFERASAGEEQLRQQERAQLEQFLSALPGAGGDVGGVGLADVLASSNPALRGVGGAILESRLAQPEGFTLSPGAQRFDAQGNVIASVPATAGQAGPFTLSPGAGRFDAEGNLIAERPATPPRPTQREQDVAALMERGFTQQQAEDIASGRVRVATDPVTGNSRLVNVATAETTNLGTGAPSAVEAPVLTAEERGRLFNQNASIDRVLGLAEGLEESAAVASGPGGTLRTLVNTLAGFAGSNAPIPAPQTAEARAAIRLFNQIAKAALVNNPRFPVAEQQIVQQLLPDPDAFFANPSVEFNKVLQLQQFLTDFRAQNERSLGIAPQEAPLTPEEQAELDALRAGR